MFTPIAIANPVYDCVFKFLLEDNEIAKELICLITQQEIVSIVLRPQEFTMAVENLVLRRMDYTAEVRDAHGKLKKVTIEMQKAKYPGDIAHFRHYLGDAIRKPIVVQRTPEELQRLRKNEERRRLEGAPVKPVEETKDEYPPVLPVYFLGYSLSEHVRKLVIKAGGGCVDMLTGNKLDATDDEFIQALTVASYIIQLPMMPEVAANEVHQVLGLFKELGPHSREIHIQIPDNEPKTSLLARMVHRLAMAAADPDIRQSMENEEIFEKSLRQHLQDHIIKEEQALEQLSDARTREAAAVEREKAAMAEKHAAIAREQAAMADKQAAMADKQAAVTEAAAMQIKMVRLLASLGKSAEEIALDLEISLAACKCILAEGV